MKKFLRSLLAMLVVLPCMFVSVACDDDSNIKKLNVNVKGTYANATVASVKEYLTDEETQTDITNGYKAYVDMEMEGSAYSFDIEASMTVLMDDAGNPDEMIIDMVTTGSGNSAGRAYYHDGWMYYSSKINGESAKYKTRYEGFDEALSSIGLSNMILLDDCLEFITHDNNEGKFTVQTSVQGTTKKFKVESTAAYTYGKINFYLIFENNVFAGLSVDVDVFNGTYNIDMEIEMVPYVGTINAPDISGYVEMNPNDL